MARLRTKYVWRKRRFVLLLVMILLTIGWSAIEHDRGSQAAQQVSDTHTVATVPNDNPSAQKAIEALGKLAVRERVSRDGYARDKFSTGWAVTDGCDMRNRILMRDLADVKLDADGCKVTHGTLEHDPYTAQKIVFKRGRTTSSAVQIEHIVAVSDAWQKGAQDLTPEQRHSFYNDPLNLLAVDGPANMQKGDADAANWLPHAGYRCRYVARQIAVKLKYELWITTAEHSAMRRVLGTCPDQLLPIDATAVVP